MRMLLVPATMLMLLACGPTEEEMKADAEAARIAMVQERVKAQLLDPGSAQFRNVTVNYEDEFIATCGEVNAKNRFGGYVGYRRFVDRAGKVLLEDGDSDMSKLAVGLAWRHCK